MSRLVLNFIHKVATRCTHLTGSHWGSEWWITDEQKAETGWDNHTNTDWDDLEDGLGWDSHAAEVGDFWGSDSQDSGYVSVGDKKDTSATPSLDELKYLDLPFRTKQYFLAYIQRILEATCLRYAREHLKAHLSDPQWKTIHLQFPGGDRAPDRLVERDWLAEDQIELEFWMRMFASISMPHSKRIFESVLDLRNAAVHRSDEGEMPFEDLSCAMELPRLLGDSKGESEITNAFRYIIDDPTLDDDTKASVENAIYIQPPCTSHYQLLGRIQTILEQACFDNANRRIPRTLTAKGWHIPEQIELQKWHDIFRTTGIEHDESANNLFPGSTMDSQFLQTSLFGARLNIRNVVAHRLPLSDEKLVAQVHRAINICILQSDWHRAIDIEVLAEMYFTQRSRAHVLRRLESVYRDGRIESLYEEKRRVAIEDYLVGMEGREGCEGGGMLVADTAGMGVEGIGKSWAQRTWSPSMHGCLMRLEEVW